MNPGRVTPGLFRHSEAETRTVSRSSEPARLTGGHCAKGAPRCIGQRVDALTLAFQGQVRSTVAATLRQVASRAAVARQPITATVEGIELVCNPRSRDGWWHLSTKDVALVVDLEATGGWRVEFKPRATWLASETPSQVYATCRLLADLILESEGSLPVDGQAPAFTGAGAARVRRIDLCADFLGFAVSDIARDAWLAPRRLQTKEHATMATFTRGARVTGFSLGKGDVSARVYDKTEELDLPQNAGDKRDAEHARWEAAGWDRSELVTRVEFQVRGDALDQFEMRDPEKLFASFDALWTYLTRERNTRDQTPWLRLSVPEPGQRRDRWRVDARWLEVQRVTFVRDAGPCERTYKRTPAQGARAVSLMLSLEATENAGMTIVDALESDVAAGRSRIDEWFPDKARQYVKEVTGGLGLVHAFMAAQTQFGADLIRDRGGEREAAQYLYERRRSARARARCLSTILAARFERQALGAAA